MRYFDALMEKSCAIIFVVCLRYLIGGAFVFSSVVKIEGGRFTNLNGINEPINSPWHLFETLYPSGLYWKFLGISQMCAGMLLMTHRFATLGAVIFLPISLNICVITFSYYFSGTPVITTLIVIANLFLLLWDYKKLLFLVQPEGQTNFSYQSKVNKLLHDNIWEQTGIILFAISVIYPIFSRDVFRWFIICFAITLYSVIFKLKKNKQTNAKKH